MKKRRRSRDERRKSTSRNATLTNSIFEDLTNQPGINKKVTPFVDDDEESFTEEQCGRHSELVNIQMNHEKHPD
jgi:hypothetical protein